VGQKVFFNEVFCYNEKNVYVDKIMMIDIDKQTYEQLDTEIKKTHYNAKRYSTVSTFGLLYFEGNLEEKMLQEFMRLSDYFLKLNDNYYFLSFHHTDENGAIKAGENLIFNLDQYLGNKSSYIAVDRIDTTESTRSTINRLYQILQEAKKHKNNRVEDENILNELY